MSEEEIKDMALKFQSALLESSYQINQKLQQENQQLNRKREKAIDLLQHYNSCQICEHSQTLAIQIQEILKGDKE